MTKIKHEIKTIDDIKYCEEHGLTIYGGIHSENTYKFESNQWNRYDKDGRTLKVYDCGIYLEIDPFYYEEAEEQEQQEATADDVGKLCRFIKNDGEEFVAVLEDYDTGYNLRYECCCGWYYHCRPLTKAEIQEFMEKAE